MGMSYDRLLTREASHFHIEEAVNKIIDNKLNLKIIAPLWCVL